MVVLMRNSAIAYLANIERWAPIHFDGPRRARLDGCAGQRGRPMKVPMRGEFAQRCHRFQRPVRRRVAQLSSVRMKDNLRRSSAFHWAAIWAGHTSLMRRSTQSFGWFIMLLRWAEWPVYSLFSCANCHLPSPSMCSNYRSAPTVGKAAQL